MEWRVGDGELDWGLVWGGAPAELEGFTVLERDGSKGLLQVAFTRPVRVRGGVREGGVGEDGVRFLPVLDSGAERGHEVDRLFRVDDWPGSDVENLDYLGVRVSGLDGREVPLEFEQFDWDGFPAPGVPTVADCVHHLRRSSGVDPIRLRTVAAVDPLVLTDRERSEWRVFFEQESGSLFAPCAALWSEEVDLENADRRNEYGDSCLQSLRDARGSGGKPDFWNSDRVEFAWGLLERPYLSLSDVDRHVLRQLLGKSKGCRWYYPQLYTGRWVPYVVGE